MPKGYIFVQVDVFDQAAIARYRANVEATIIAYGGRYLVRGADNPKILEGEPNGSIRTTIVEFPSAEQALKWYESAEYRDLRSDRYKAARGKVWVLTGCE